MSKPYSPPPRCGFCACFESRHHALEGLFANTGKRPCDCGRCADFVVAVLAPPKAGAR